MDKIISIKELIANLLEEYEKDSYNNYWLIPACYFTISFSVIKDDRRECSNLIVLYIVVINHKKYYNKKVIIIVCEFKFGTS